VDLSFEISTIIPADADEIYHAWLDSAGHSAMTGSPAQIKAEQGSSFEAWDGYITGTILELVPDQRILQTWRTAEFHPDEADSMLEITLEQLEDGTKLTLRHSRLPAHGMQYEDGWRANYFEPMKVYFAG